MNFIHIQNKQNKLYFYFSTVPAKDDKETKKRDSRGKEGEKLNYGGVCTRVFCLKKILSPYVKLIL